MSDPPVAKPLSVWLDALGRPNFVILLILVPFLADKFGGITGPVRHGTEALFNQRVLLLLVSGWLISLLWEGFAFWMRKRCWPHRGLLAVRCCWSLPGVLLVLGLLQTSRTGALVYPATFLAALLGIFALGKWLPAKISGLQNGWQDLRLPKGGIRVLMGIWIYLMIACLMPLRQFGMGGVDRISRIKANMHTCQTVLETFHQHHQRYPVTLSELGRQGIAENELYRLDFHNPFTTESGLGRAYLDYQSYLKQRLHPPSVWRMDSLLGIELDLQWPVQPEVTGVVLFDLVSPQAYRIYGTDLAGNLIRDKGRDLML